MMMTETYFDFDSETMQITQRFSESSGYGSPTPGLSPLPPVFAKSHEHVNNSEDTGFDSSSDRSSLTLSQDGMLTPRSASPRSSSSYCQNLLWSTCPRASTDSLTSKSLKKCGSKDSINTSSSFWDSNFPAETKEVLMKVRDQMRLSLQRVKELEEQVKQIPLLKVKISVLQEEKRQLASQLRNKRNLSKKSKSCSTADHYFYPPGEEMRSIGVGDCSIHDILCRKCKELQDKLLGHLNDISDRNEYETKSRIGERFSQSAKHQTRNRRDDTIQVFQDRYTQTNVKGEKDVSTQTTFIEDRRTFVDNSCDPINVVTKRSIGVGQIGSFVKDAYVGDDNEISTFRDIGIQKIIDVKDKNCGSQTINTENIGINVSPTLISIGVGCSFVDNTKVNIIQSKHSVGSQTTQNDLSTVSVGVGMCSIDEYEQCESCKLAKRQCISVEDILESNKLILNTQSVGVNTCSWQELNEHAVLDNLASKSTADIGVTVSVTTRTVGCGEQSVAELSCLRCNSKSYRSLGVNCKPKVCDAAVGENAPTEQLSSCEKSLSSVGVGECCVTDNYCERCFSLQTRNIAVGNGNILYDDIDGRCCVPENILCSANGESTQNHEAGYLSGSERMFSAEYERITDEWEPHCEDEKLKRLTNPSKEILLACELLQKHFQDDEHLDENKLLVCMKSIEDYWFNCVTELNINKEFMSNLLSMLKQNLPLLLEGLINSQDENGNTALHYLVTSGKFDCVEELLITDLCDLNITNKAGYSAVMLASLKECCEKKDQMILKRLFEKGNLNCIAQSTGQTALMLAAGAGRVEMVDLLLQCGAAKSINTTDLDGSTSLMCACEHGYAAIVKYLLAVHGCDASIQDHDGSTGFSIAMEHSRKDIALMIYSHLQRDKPKIPKMKCTGQVQLQRVKT